MHELNGRQCFGFAAGGEIDFGAVSRELDGRGVADSSTVVLSVSDVKRKSSRDLLCSSNDGNFSGEVGNASGGFPWS
jgi:hypothetical protein